VLTALAGTEPISGAQDAPAQKLQFFLSESAWEAREINARRLRMLREDPQMSPHKRGVLVIDETGDRKDGNATDHVGYQYLSSVGRIANGGLSLFRAFGLMRRSITLWTWSPTHSRQAS
jgi:SRSO17 transposase